jgi:hypothetical protein
VISTRRARKLRAYVLHKRKLKRELDAYLLERQALINAWPTRDCGCAIWNESTKEEA